MTVCFWWMALTFELQRSMRSPTIPTSLRSWAFRYKIALCIKTGDICWWAGPYLPGIWNDNMIFKHGLAKNL